MAVGDTFPYPLNHVGVSVPDAVAAAKWYTEVLGFTQLRPPTVMDRATSPDGPIFKIYPSEMNKVTVIAMSAGNGLGFEVFQFDDPKINDDTKASFERDFKRGGFFHIGVTTPDVEALCEKIVATGGRKLGATVPVYQYEAIYAEDPWGNVVELISASFERAMANRG